MKNPIQTILLIFVFAIIPALGAAHEGHAHKVMGTIAALLGQRLELKSKDGKLLIVVLDEKTVLKKGKDAAKASDLAEGQRVVVAVDKSEPPHAVEILIGK